MQNHNRPAGATSQIITVEVWDSSSAVGAKLAGLTFETASLTAYYNRVGAAGAATAISLVTATKGTWVSGGFVAIDGTNMPGTYELHVPDAALAVGAKAVDIVLKGAANMVSVCIHVELDAAKQTDGARVFADTTAISGDTTAADNLELAYDGTGYAGGTTKPQVDVVAIGGVVQSATDLKDFADTGYDPSTHKVAGVVLTDTTTTNTDMRGTDSAALASVCTEGRLAELDAANLPTDVAAIPTNPYTGTPPTPDAIADEVQTRAIAAVTSIPEVTLAATQGSYAPAKAGDAMTCADATAAKDDLANTTDGLGALLTAIGTRAAPGAQMDLVNAPNATAVSAIVTAITNLATYGLSALNTLLVTTGIKIATNADKTDYSGTMTCADATSAKTAAESADGKLTAGRVGKLDSLTFTTPLKVDASATVAGVPTVGEIDTELTTNHGAGAWGASSVVPAGYTRYTIAAGTLLPGTVIDAYLPTDTTYATPQADNTVIASNGGGYIDLPDDGAYTLVGRLTGKEDTILTGVTT